MSMLDSIADALDAAWAAAGEQFAGDKPAGSPTVPCPLAVDKDPSKESKTKDNAIDLVFDPDKSEKVKECNKIVHVQFVRKSIDGKVVKPGDAYDGWKYRDKVTTDKGWGVDHLDGETTPDYQQGSGNGKKDDTYRKDAKIHDAPNFDDDAYFYDKDNNPKGWKTYKNEFKTFAYCMEGPDCGKWYEGVNWEYVKTADDQKNKKPGTSKITNQNVTTAPDKDLIEAFDKFNKDKGYTPCKK